MQQDRGSDQDMKQNNQQQQDRRLKPLTGENQQQQPQPPQKCPRCESLNTKFCYYNNYSLSQPRYFCKSCRRYWTQGGTLRNVPVGGGCRKGKRTKTTPSSSSSGENSRSQLQIPHQQPQQQSLTTPQSMISSNPIMIGGSSALRTKESGSLASSMGSYYPGGGFLSSLAAIQSMNNNPQTAFNPSLNQALSIGGELGGSSNLGLLQGYSVSSFGSQQHHHPIQQTHFFHMGNRDIKTGNVFPSDQEGLIQSSRQAAGSSSQQNWHQSFNPTVSEAGLWSINNSSSSASTNPSNTTAGSSLNPNQWPHLPGYGAPPP